MDFKTIQSKIKAIIKDKDGLMILAVLGLAFYLIFGLMKVKTFGRGTIISKIVK